jgi:hypothetical protein
VRSRYYHVVSVAPTGSLALCGPHLHPLLLVVPGPVGVSADIGRADRLALASLYQSTRSW